MGLKKKDDKLSAITVILGEGSKMNGTFEFEGISRIDGIFEGEINTKDTLIIGETAEIKADINVGKLVLEGKLEGNIKATIEIVIQPTGKFTGDLETPALIIEKGAVFNGSSKMIKESKITELNIKNKK